MIDISIFEGDITDAPGDAICTSTNPRLSLMMGTGGAVRERGGFEVLRACEEIVKSGHLPPGSAHVTTAGSLPYKIAIHCVAGNETHLTSAGIIRACVLSALARAAEHRCTSVVMPVFGSGHGRFKFEPALKTMIEAIQTATTPVTAVVIAVNEAERAAAARRIVADLTPTLRPEA